MLQWRQRFGKSFVGSYGTCSGGYETKARHSCGIYPSRFTIPRQL